MLICAGVLMCISAEDMAVKEGVALFTQVGDSENNYSETHEIENDALKKIDVSLTDVSVNVYGGAQKSRIELVNFTDGGYDLTISQSQITLSDISGISGIINLDTFEIHFDGFRNYLNYWKYKDKARTVNIYIADDAPVLYVKLNTESGDIALHDMHFDCDYKLSSENGSVTLDNVTTGSEISIDSTKELAASLNNVTARELVLDASGVGEVTITQSSFTHKLEAKIKNGNFTYDRPEADFSGFNVSLSASEKIILNGRELTTNKYNEQNVEISLRPIEPSIDDSNGTDTTEQTAESDKSDEVNMISITVKNGRITVTCGKSVDSDNDNNGNTETD